MGEGVEVGNVLGVLETSTIESIVHADAFIYVSCLFQKMSPYF